MYVQRPRVIQCLQHFVLMYARLYKTKIPYIIISLILFSKHWFFIQWYYQLFISFKLLLCRILDRFFLGCFNWQSRKGCFRMWRWSKVCKHALKSASLCTRVHVRPKKLKRVTNKLSSLLINRLMLGELDWVGKQLSNMPFPTYNNIIVFPYSTHCLPFFAILYQS